MAQPLISILSRQRELTRTARLFTGDINEAALLVGRVVSRALGKWSSGDVDGEIAGEMQRDLERMIEQARLRRH